MLGEWFSDLGTYLWRMGHRYISAAITGASLLLVILSDVKHHSIGLPVWGWALVAMGGIVIAGFLEWRALYHHPDHVLKIRRVAESVHDSLADDDQHINYSDGHRSDEILRVMFQFHCPRELSDLLNEWDSLEDEGPLIERQAEERIRAEAEDLVRAELSEDDGWLSINSAVNSAQQFVSSQMRRTDGNYAIPPLQVGHDTINWGGTILKYVDIPDDEARQEWLAFTQSMQERVVDVARTWPADQLRELANRRKEIATDAYPQLQLMIHGGPIRGRCPSCRP